MRVFVTGATGFLGKQVVARLVSEGHTVRVLVRRPAAYRAPAGVETVAGGLEDLPNWAESLRGQDVVVHLAGIIEMWGKWAEFDRTIVKATRDLIAAADARGVRRFIYISSESVLQDGVPLLDVDETTPPPRRPSSYYGQAKLLAEQAVQGHAGPIERIILRPTFIWGEESMPLRDMAQRAKEGKLPLFDNGQSSFEHVHVDNVALAISLALTGGRSGGVYLITNNEPMPVREFLGGVLAAFGAPMPRRSLPSGPVYKVAKALETIWRTLRLPGRPPVTRFEVEFLSLPRRFRTTRAAAELGYQPTVTYAEGVARLKA
ncbi:MAG: NAD-dependent epimerase/dehydratase family protein [Micromonosporaceae bacterium]|nr:NAD-dependent epimerase/dehydratase family protein [Micromonosporaceae bacterium]